MAFKRALDGQLVVMWQPMLVVRACVDVKSRLEVSKAQVCNVLVSRVCMLACFSIFSQSILARRLSCSFKVSLRFEPYLEIPVPISRCKLAGGPILHQKNKGDLLGQQSPSRCAPGLRAASQHQKMTGICFWEAPLAASSNRCARMHMVFCNPFDVTRTTILQMTALTAWYHHPALASLVHIHPVSVCVSFISIQGFRLLS